MKYLPVLFLVLIISCKSDTQRANETIDLAIKMNEQSNNRNQAAGQLPRQQSPYDSAPVEALTQEKLIADLGVKTRKTTYSSGSWMEEEYDTEGRRIQSSYFDGEATEVSTFEYVYDGDLLIKETEIENEEESYTREYAYDDQGRKIKYSFIYPGEAPSVTTYTWDDEKNTRREKSEDYEFLEYYNNHNLVVYIEGYDETGKVDSKVETRYNEQGWRIAEDATVMGFPVNDKFSYNDKGQLLKRDRGGISSHVWTYQYDERGLMLEERKEVVGGDEVTSYTYTFH